jgi:hypothetical protein
LPLTSRRHGDFADTAAIAQALKAVLAAASARLGAVQREALDQIAVKIARICAGDPTCADHWRDLAGYAWLAGRDLVASEWPNSRSQRRGSQCSRASIQSN